MRWWVRSACVIVGFLVPLIGVYNVYVSTQPVHHDLSDIGTGLFGVLFGVLAGLIGASVAWVATRRRPR
jgi:hypothetical protein